jgi:hypothetical protein
MKCADVRHIPAQAIKGEMLFLDMRATHFKAMVHRGRQAD